MITENYIKTYSILSEAIDFRLLAPQIAFLEDVKIDDAIGQPTSTDLRTKYANQTLTPIEEGAVELIQKMLLGYLESYSVDTLSTRIRSKGVQKENGNNSNPAPEMNAGEIKAQANERARHYSLRLNEYIQDNIGSFPLYSNRCNDDSSDAYIDVYFPK